ncbi:RNaseH domain-containing protein [Cupriavidus sp. SS-3]|uniref:RNaseH domain-containing protein n=1 Tax=Cupriavidus sp. SS-3 TaxID=3109596 RepID=UPI002DB73363|nr:RNaseH domain-containing protein [Cupriavidus sp. SS-3]MEC3768774.1 RNaseH domain-containing protein [Cupriavidus sp. SS-3]
MTTADRDVAFALEFSESAPPLVHSVAAIRWSTDVLRIMKQIRDEATSRAKEKDDEAYVHLPYASLRAQLQLEIEDWTFLKEDIGLRSFPELTKEPEPWGLLPYSKARDSVECVRDAFARWSEGALSHFCQGRDAYILGISALRKLNEINQVVRFMQSQVRVFPWNIAGKAGMLSPFDVSAGLLASQLAGKELFPELGPVVRVVGSPNRNKAELMTRPHYAAGGYFSLVCEISLETLPGATKPIVYLKFKRRRWADSLNSRYPASPTIGGYVFPHHARPISAYRFSVMRRKGAWVTDHGYPVYEHALDLVKGYQDEDVLQYPCDERASVVVMVKAEVAEASRSNLQAGVPLVDQADAFAAIAHTLEGLGLRPFLGFQSSKPIRHKAPPLGVMKAEVAVARLLALHGIDDADTESAIENATSAPSSRWFKLQPPIPDPSHDRVVAAMQMLVKDTAYVADVGRQRIYFLSHSADDIEWVKLTAKAILGNNTEVISAPLPMNTYGPRSLLPVDTGSKKQRFDARVREWQRYADQVGVPDRSMFLIQAPLFYETPEGQKKPDDKINKLAARKALGSRGCTVQYLLPSEPGRMDRFLPRLQASILDLAFGHAGFVWGLKQARDACFGSEADAPQWACAVSSLQVSTEWDRQQSVFVATRLECATGEAWVRFAYADAEHVMSPWMRFDQGATYLASRRVEFPRMNADQRILLANFFASTFDDITSLDANAVVFIDSTRTARLASWLGDVGVRTSQRQIAPGIVLSQRWPMLRVLRVREQAPSIGQEKIHGHSTEHGMLVRSWTSTQRLFEVDGTSAPTFWSLAKPSTHHKRGASCYRSIVLPALSKPDEATEPFAMFPAQPDKQHLTSRAVEFVILQKQPHDSNLQLASFAQHLRAGMLTARNEPWVTTPTPLRIIEKLSEYMRA